MKSLILVSALLIGFTASAQVCKVSQDTADQIDWTKESSMMAKSKHTTIRALIGSDACVSKYLNDDDSATLAREIQVLKFVPSEQILNYFAEQAELKAQLSKIKACEASAATLERVEQLRTSGMHVKARYVSMKGLLAEDECIASELNQSDVVDLAQRIVFAADNALAVQLMISEALNK
jgi:hypothetical protein